MSDIIIEGKNLDDITESNFQTIGPYSQSIDFEGRTIDHLVVNEPWQGRRQIGVTDTDHRFKLGTETENFRSFWELQTSNPISRISQFDSKEIKTAKGDVRSDNKHVISEETDFSVDAFTFTQNDDTGKTVPLFFYYDRKLHPDEYYTAVNGKVNMKIELRESGRDREDKVDNFLFRDTIRPFFLGLNISSSILFDRVPNGQIQGDGAYSKNSQVNIQALPDIDSYFRRWVDGTTKQYVSNHADFTFSMPNEDIERVAEFHPNPILKLTPRVNNEITETEALVALGTSYEWTEKHPSLPGSTLSFFSENMFNDDTTFDNLSDPEASPFSFETVRNNIKPTRPFIMLTVPLASDILFENFSYADNNNQQQTFFPMSVSFDEGDNPFGDPERLEQFQSMHGMQQVTNADGDIITTGLGLSRFGNSSTNAQHFIDHTVEYPGGIWQIYANYTRLFYYIHSYNDFILQDVGEYRDKFTDRLIWGYDGILLNDGVASSGYSGSLAVSLGAGLTMTPILSDGYTTGSFYWTNIIPNGPDYNAELGEIPLPGTAFSVNGAKFIGRNPNPDSPTVLGMGAVSDGIWNEFDSPIRGTLSMPVITEINSRADAVAYNNGEDPQEDQYEAVVIGSSTSPPSGYTVGSRTGRNGIFKVTSVDRDSQVDPDASDEYYWEIDWGYDPTVISNDYSIDGLTMVIPPDQRSQGEEYNLGGPDQNIPHFFSDLSNQIVRTRDAFHTIAHHYTQRGTYIKIIKGGTAAEDSSFILEEPNTTHRWRTKQQSPHIDAPMYKINRDLPFRFSVNTTTMELPQYVFESLIARGEQGEVRTEFQSLASMGMTFARGSNPANTMQLTYPAPSRSEESYVKYIQLTIKSDYSVQPFVGVFTVDQSDANPALGTVNLIFDEVGSETFIGNTGPIIGERLYDRSLEEFAAGENEQPPVYRIIKIIPAAEFVTAFGMKHPDRLEEVNSLIDTHYSDESDEWKEDVRGWFSDGFSVSVSDVFNNDRMELNIVADPEKYNDSISEFLQDVADNQTSLWPRIPLAQIRTIFEVAHTITIVTHQMPISPPGDVGEYYSSLSSNYLVRQDFQEDEFPNFDLEILSNDELLQSYTSSDTSGVIVLRVKRQFFNGDNQLKIYMKINKNAFPSLPQGSLPELSVIDSGVSNPVNINYTTAVESDPENYIGRFIINDLNTNSGELYTVLDWGGVDGPGF